MCANHSLDTLIQKLETRKGSKYAIIDGHIHVVDFTQHTDGLKRLLHYMDQCNVPQAVISGLPMMKMWAAHEKEAPDYYLSDDSRCYYYSYTDGIVAEEYKKLTPKEQDRFYPLITGFNPNDKYAVEHIKRMIKYYPGVFSGIGEVLLRHDDLTALTYGEAPRPNSESLYPIFEFAIEQDIPVLVHQNVSSVWVPDHPKYLPEFEMLLREFPRARIVFAHCGISRRVYSPFYHEMIERLLDEYGNLYVDLSWILYDVVICPEDQPNEYWITLAEKYSHRMCLGSDLLNNFERLGVNLERFDRFLDALSSEARDNLCRETARKIYGTKKCTL